MRDALRAARERARLRQEDVAERAGIDRTAYVKIEGGHRSPSLRVAFAIASAVGAELGELFPDLAAPPAASAG